MSAVGFTGYPITAIHAARKLRAGGETLAEIAEFIGEEYGQTPSTGTVSEWTSRRVAARARAYNRRYHKAKSAGGASTGGRLGRTGHSQEFRVARMRALAEQGLDFTAIATVMSFDYRETYSAPDIASLVDGVPRCGPRGVQWKDRAAALIKTAPDLSSAEIARRVGVSHTSVQKYRKTLA